MGGRSPTRPDPLDPKISGLAARQHGVVTRRQLLALGCGRGAIELRLRAGRLHRVHSGVYLVGHTARPPRAREMAAVLACGPRALVSHRSAAGLWELAPRPMHDVEVTVLGSGKPRRPGIKTRRTGSLTPRDVRKLEGIPVTSPARTLLDLSALLDEAELERVVAQAEIRRLVRLEELVGQLEHHPGRRGAAALREVLALPGGPARTRSRAEARLLRLLRKSGLPVPKANARVGGYEVDLLWEDAQLAVEFDGFGFHADRRSFELDRLRDAELQARGYRVIRVTWRQLIRDADGLLDRIGRTLAVSRLERGGDSPSY